MVYLLNDTVQLSRSGGMTNPPENVPFGEIVEEALARTFELIKSSGAEISKNNDFPTVHVNIAKDNGRVIDPNQHEKVFTMFYWVKRSGNGTGAGPTIIKLIIEVHGGRI